MSGKFDVGMMSQHLFIMKEVLCILKSIGYQGSLTMEFMYRVADPYSAIEFSTQTDLMDRYAKQSIDYIRVIERSL